MPARAFCECGDTKPRKTSTWFALSEDRQLFAFACLARHTPLQGNHELFGFLTASRGIRRFRAITSCSAF